MEDMRKRVVDDRNILKRIANAIPGYGGYLDKEMRRDADKLVRDYLVRRLEVVLRKLNDVQEEVTRSGSMDDVGLAARVYQHLVGFADRVRTATYGYAGWFDAVTVREAQLDALYEFDERLVAQAAQLESLVESAAKAARSGQGLADALRTLDKAITALMDAWAARQDAIIQTPAS